MKCHRMKCEGIEHTGRCGKHRTCFIWQRQMCNKMKMQSSEIHREMDNGWVNYVYG